MYSVKNSTLLLLKVLEKYSDGEHILNSSEIEKYLMNDYNFSINRKTIKNNVNLLREMGYDISDFEDNGKGYYLANRLFDTSETSMLIDVIASSKFIPKKESDDLINRLKNFQSIYSRQILDKAGIHDSNFKTKNKNVFFNTEIIKQAIVTKNKISFKYFTYNLDKKLIPRKTEKYIANPYAIVSANEHYYLVCNNDNFCDVSNFRIDFIKDIEILDEKAKDVPRNINIDEYIKHSIYMYSGDENYIELLCDNYILKDVIDRFGDEVKISKQDNEKFIALLNVNPIGLVYWIMQYLKYCEVLKPTSLRETIKDELVEAIEKYSK